METTTNFTKQPFDKVEGERRVKERKVVLKLSSAFRHIKSYRNLPQTFDELLSLVQKFHKAQVDRNSVRITYTNATGSTTAITNDDELKAAIQYADSTERKDLKLTCESDEFGRAN